MKWLLARQAMGMEVTVISTSPKKEKEAREHLGADHFIVSRDDKQMAVRTFSHNLGSGSGPQTSSWVHCTVLHLRKLCAGTVMKAEQRER